RAMCYARLGRADEARQDAAACLAADRSAFRLYQMAGLHAQLAKAGGDASRAEALRLLARALRTGFADWKLLNTDTDLDPVRGDAGFKALTAAAAELDRAGK